MLSADISRKKLWLAALKPPMYSVAVLPIILGTAIAFGETKQFNSTNFWLFLISAILILAWLNLSNDVFDADTGIDINKHHSIVNLTGKKSLVFWLSNTLLILGIIGICAISFWQQDPTVISLVILCCFLGYTYQGPPFRLGYQGLGEIICFLTFGPMAIAAVYYSQTQSFSRTSLAASIILGISTSLILFCSHFHQVKDDLAAGKLSPIVRLGTKTGAWVLAIATGSLFVLTVLFSALKIYPVWTLLIFLSLPWAWYLINYVYTYHDQPEQVKNCKFLAVNLHFISGILFALGFILPRLV
jgi:1,4-dihydroxy-2-naphthoate octaprenyltransferase